jgi:ppGpp synthetase/RelA/SpoT-type nucleotidyltranferase
MKRGSGKKGNATTRRKTAKTRGISKKPKASEKPSFDARKYTGVPDKEWVAVHAPRFGEARPAFAAYEEFLKIVLKSACRKLAPLAIVEARAKGVASFAEKIIRKREEYTRAPYPPEPDPLVRMTDLCGGRVVTQTSEQVQEVCRFIEKAFDIDWPNSEDVSKRLKPAEFGYRSVHYIVIPNEDKLRAAGVDVAVPPRIRRLKAEIQVRTMLEHASADIAHDLLYKTDVKVPDRLRRMSAGLWAVLEGAGE